MVSIDGKITICSTPIGNTGDITQRVKQALELSDLIYAEDTRVSAKLLSVYNIKTPLYRLDQNTIKKDALKVINQAKEGLKIAYCSDAGMPGVSDPGIYLIKLAHKHNIDVDVLPGPTAAITAYVASGFENANFYFAGFLPKKYGDKSSSLKNLKVINGVIIIYESPKRLLATLEAISQVFSTEEVSVCRELTKIHEEIKIGTAVELLKDFQARDSVKGEIVICINNHADQQNFEDHDLIDLAEFLAKKSLKTPEISTALIKAFKIGKNQAYDIALKVKK